MTDTPQGVGPYADRLRALEADADGAALEQSRAGVDEVAARFDQGLLVREAVAEGVAAAELAEAAGLAVRTLRDRRQFAEADLFAGDDGEPDRDRFLTWAASAAERAVEAGARLTYRHARAEVFRRPSETDPEAAEARRVARHLGAVRALPCCVCGRADGPKRFARQLATDAPDAESYAAALTAVPLCDAHVATAPTPGLWRALAGTLAELAEAGAGAVAAPRHALAETLVVPARVLDEPAWFAEDFDRAFPPERRYWRPLEIAEVLGSGKDPVYRAVSSGELEAFRVGGTYLAARPAVRLWLVEHNTVNLPGLAA